MKTAQIIVLVILILGFFVNLYRDIHGAEARKPLGFWGAIVSILVLVGLFCLYLQAGAFSTLF